MTYGYVPAGQPGAGQVHTITDGTSTVTLGYDADRHVVSARVLRRHRHRRRPTSTTACWPPRRTSPARSPATCPTAWAGSETATQTRGGTTLASVTYTYDAHVPGRDDHAGQRRRHDERLDTAQPASSQRTTSASGALVEAHTYTYDDHGNVTIRIDTTPAAAGSPRPRHLDHRATATTPTTGYRLRGLPRRARVRDPRPRPRRTRSTRPATSSARPRSPGATTTDNTIDPAGQLTSQTTDGKTVSQSFDGDGQVLTSLSGWAMTYDAFGRMLSASKAGTTATYAYWPDGTRKSTTSRRRTPPRREPTSASRPSPQAGTGKGTYGGYSSSTAPGRASLGFGGRGGDGGPGPPRRRVG